MGLKEKFDEALEKYRKEEEEKERREKEMEEFLEHVQERLDKNEALIISVPSKMREDESKIIIGAGWVGIENPSSLIIGFTCIPKNKEEYNVYVKKEGFFRDVLRKAIEKPEEAKIQIIKVSHEIIAGPYLDDYRQILASDE